MEKFELLYDYAEGTLDISKEEGLFADLAVDIEMRNEFRQLITLNSAVKNNRLLFLNDPGSKTKLLAGLGLGAGAGASASGSMLSGIWGSVKTSYVIVSLLSCLVSGLAVYYFTGGGKETGRYLRSTAYTGGKTEQSSSAVPDTKNFEKESPVISGENSSRQNTVIKYVYIHKNDKNADKDALASADGLTEEKTDGNGWEKASDGRAASGKDALYLFPLSKSGLESLSRGSLSESIRQENTMRGSGGNPVALSSLAPADYGGKARGLWSLEWKMNDSWHVPSATISPYDLSKFNNNSLAMLYKFHDVFSLGFEMRQETFFQRFNGTTEEGRFIYEQQPNFTTLGLLGRFYLGDVFGAEPFSQVFLGRNNVGTVVRLSGGLQYGITEEFAIIVGAEYSRLFYEYGGQDFFSGKYGLNYGIRYRIY